MNIDVIICTYNRAKMLRRAIQSILEADIPAHTSIRLLVVDNNSTDDTESVIRGFSTHHPEIAIQYLFEEQLGKSHALNKALKHITGDLVFFFDDDQTVDRPWLTEMVNALQSFPEYNCFGGKVIAVYPNRLPEWIDIADSMKFLKSVFGHKDEGDKAIEYSDETISRMPGGGNMFFRRIVFEMNGPFRTDLGPVGKKLGFSEDAEFCHRLIEKGERFMYIPTVVVYHPVHAERLKKEYLLNWQYRVGRSEVRRNGGYKDTTKVFGVPRYLYRKVIEHAIGWVFSTQPKKRFYHRLRLYYNFGEIIEHIRIRLMT